jgi:RNA polymerase sigma-70 factor (ECF subfamily)
MDRGEFPRVLAAARGGEREAVATLYATFNPMLVRFLHAQAPDIGEDLAHDTWLEAAPRLREFRGDEGSFRVWLLTIARNELARSDRAARRAPTSPITSRVLTEDDLRRWHSDDVRVADAAVTQLLAGLPPAHAEILLLRVVGGLSAEETGALVGKTAGAVRVIQHRALHRLAERLSSTKLRQRPRGARAWTS